MQCLNPVRVPNQSRFFNLNTRHSFYVTGRCGKCAGCQQNKSAEWSFRAYKHAEDCFRVGGYVLFDTLTYSDKFVPHLRDYEEFSSLLPSEDFMCFSSEDLRLFHVRLRRRLEYEGFGSGVYNYFVSTEYGTDPTKTHRPHYHLLFYVYKDLDPLVFSRFVSESWRFGRTDGYSYKPTQYILGNVFRSLVVGSRRVVNYVTKYVQKSSAFEKQINKRINLVLHRLAPDVDWVKSDKAKVLRRKLYRIATQFHRQSLGFGSSALYDDQPEDLFARGYFKMPNGKPSMFNKIPISSYYLRKICYYKFTHPDGYQEWFVRPFARDLLVLRDKAISKSLSDSYRAYSFQFGLPSLDFDALADYVLHWRGRLNKADLPLKSPLRVLRPIWFVYASSADKNHFNHRFITDKYCGWNGHYKPVTGSCWKFKDIDSELVSQSVDSRFDGFDDWLSQLDRHLSSIRDCEQSKFERLQQIHDVAKRIFI